MRTDTKSNTYRGQDVLIESIKEDINIKFPFISENSIEYKDAWNLSCDSLAEQATKEGLFTTVFSILELKDI